MRLATTCFGSKAAQPISKACEIQCDCRAREGKLVSVLRVQVVAEGSSTCQGGRCIQISRWRPLGTRIQAIEQHENGWENLPTQNFKCCPRMFTVPLCDSSQTSGMSPCEDMLPAATTPFMCVVVGFCENLVHAILWDCEMASAHSSNKSGHSPPPSLL